MADLYILTFPARNKFKVGWAAKVSQRALKLEKTWGLPDYAESYWLQNVPQNIVRKLETIFHFLLLDHSDPYESGDGFSEFFHIKGLPSLLEGIELFSNNISAIPKLQKGIPKRQLSSTNRLRHGMKPIKKSFREHKETAQARLAFIDICGRAARWINVLKMRENRIQFQIDVIDDRRVIFYFRLPKSIKDRFDFHHTYTVNSPINKTVSYGDFYQSATHYKKEDMIAVTYSNLYFEDPVVCACWNELLHMVRLLPQYSSAVEEDFKNLVLSLKASLVQKR